jgi:hypothetical protein
LFVLPEYPANGWNDAPQAPLPDHGHPDAPVDMPADVPANSASRVTIVPPFSHVVQTVMMNEQLDVELPLMLFCNKLIC